jgi:phosphoglycerate kinase
MGMSKLSIKDLDLKNKIVFIRVDFNVPLKSEGTEVASDNRLRASLPTIRYALEHGAGVVLASHLGRPQGKYNPKLSLAPVASRLSQLLGKPVSMSPDCVGPATASMKPKPGDVLLLENLRFHPEEELNDREFAKQLASLADLYVDDAFGSAHRAHASTVGMISCFQNAAAGLLMEKELEWLTRVGRNPERPCVALLGGAKVSDKVGLVQHLAAIVERLLIGGAMAYTFLCAKGVPTGCSPVEKDKIGIARQILREAGDRLLLPLDHVVVRDLGSFAKQEVVTTIAPDQIAVDIGPNTVKEYSNVLRGARTVIWNGPMGIFEMPPFDNGTNELAKCIAQSGAVSVVAGGDSEKAVQNSGVADKITYISSGGGATLEFLAGMDLPGVNVLTERK